MRFILWFCLALGVIWGGYWFVGSRAVEQGAAAWFADSAAQGIEASHEGIAVRGFPSRFDLTVTRPRLADPATGLGWTAPFAQVFSMTWKPWHVIAVLPHDQEITLPGERIAVTSSRIIASLRLSPGAALTFAETVLEAHDLALASDAGWKLDLASAVLAMARDPAEARDYRLGAEILALRPDPSLARALPDLGEVISRLHLDATLKLTAPLDRNAAQTQPQVAGLTLRALSLDWGALQISGQGGFLPGPDGLAQGQIDLHIRGWHLVPALAAELGLIRPEMAKSLNDGLAALAASGTDPRTLALPLKAEDGWMTLGPLPLGPAPAMVQRQ